MLGRLLLAEPAHRLGEKPVILVCSLCCLALQIVFWRVDNIIADSVVVSVFGFLSGPFFASVTTSCLTWLSPIIDRLIGNVGGFQVDTHTHPYSRPR